MASIRTSLLAGAFLFAAPAAALAAGEYVVDRVQITGNTLLPTATLLSAVQSHPGAHVTQDEILADRDAIVKLYADKHMGVKIRTALANKGGNHVVVMYTVAETAAPAPVKTATGLKLGRMSFAGNNRVGTDELQAAVGEQPGAPVTDASVDADLQKIGDLYKKKNVGVSIERKISYPEPGTVDVTWVIKEAKAARKKTDTDNPGGMSVSQ